MILLSIIILLWLVYSVLQQDDEIHSFDAKATTALKGVLAVLIVLHHVEINVFKGSYWLFHQMENWGLWIVVLFFFMSGYGLQYSIEKKEATYLDGFLHKRLLKVVLPLIVASIVYMLATSTSLTQYGLMTVDGKTPLPNSWFAYTIVLFYAGFYVVQKIARSQLMAQILLGCFTLLYVALMSNVLHWDPYWYVTAYGFNLGMLYRWMESNRTFEKCKSAIGGGKSEGLRFLLWQASLRAGRRVNGLGIVMIISMFLLFDHYSLPIQSLLWGLGMPYVVFTLIRRSGFPCNKVLNWLGKFSYEIYLTHGAFFFIYKLIPCDGILHDVGFLLALFVSTLLASMMLKWICNIIAKRQIHK